MMRYNSNVEMPHLKLIKSIFRVNVEHQHTDERIAITVSLKNNGEFSENGRRANFVQRFQTGAPDEAPFFLDVEFAAMFMVNPAPLPLERPYYVRQVFPIFVFPYLREYVAETTRRGGFSPLIINQNVFDDEEWGQPAAPEDNKWVH